jgi:hypothetical protein
MEWARILAYITGTVDQELLLRNEYLVAENRILKSLLQREVFFETHDMDCLYSSDTSGRARTLVRQPFGHKKTRQSGGCFFE